MAHEGEEGRDGKGLVAVADDLEVDGMPVVPDTEEGRGRVDGNHEQDADDVLLFSRLGVVGRMPPHQVEAGQDGDGGAPASYYQSQLVKGEGTGDLGLRPNCSGDMWSAKMKMMLGAMALEVLGMQVPERGTRREGGMGDLGLGSSVMA